MTILDCTVTGCVYNADKCCCKGDIMVEGKKAKHNAQTCCGSFKERRLQGTLNVEKDVSKEIDVSCKACNCQFNKDKKCTAKHIGIAGGDACESRETECASFYCCS